MPCKLPESKLASVHLERTPPRHIEYQTSRYRYQPTFLENAASKRRSRLERSQLSDDYPNRGEEFELPILGLRWIEAQRTSKQAASMALSFVEMLVESYGGRMVQVLRNADNETHARAYANAIVALGSVDLKEAKSEVVFYLRDLANGVDSRMRQAAEDAIDLITFADETSL